jgi:hypothetical protein
VMGWSKEGGFKHLPERSWGKVHGSKDQGLSMQGKETLVKSVLEAVRAYPMGCFRLSNGCGVNYNLLQLVFGGVQLMVSRRFIGSIGIE